MTEKDSHLDPPHSGAMTAVALLAGILVINLSASICFKEGGTNAAYRWPYFVGGNVLGISATALLMMLYRYVNANLAMVLVVACGGILVQFAFWLLHHSPLTGLQWIGIVLTVLGTVVAMWFGGNAEPTPVPAQQDEIEST
jgi:drug/metabolite transporter (DMT)-like permease